MFCEVQTSITWPQGVCFHNLSSFGAFTELNSVLHINSNMNFCSKSTLSSNLLTQFSDDFTHHYHDISKLDNQCSMYLIGPLGLTMTGIDIFRLLVGVAMSGCGWSLLNFRWRSASASRKKVAAVLPYGLSVIMLERE